MAEIEKMDIQMASDMGGDAADIKTCPFCGSHDIAYGKYEHAAGIRWEVLCMNCLANIDPGYAQNWGAVRDMWNRRAAPESKPLTLEQLQQMDGEPVWVEWLSKEQDLSCWGFHDEDGVCGYCANFDDDDYGKMWLAYTRKPEGSATP